MGIRGFGRLQQVRQRIASKALILMYHRVAEVDLDPWGLCVTPHHFAEQLEVVQKYAYPLSLKQFVQAYQNGKIPNRAVVITFDDGYADNLHNAKPLLEEYNTPATVFVSTGYIGQEREFWWDELERLLLKPGKLPEKLSLTINGSVHQWELGTAADYSLEKYQRDRTCKAWEAAPGSRMHFYYTIWEVLRPLSDSQRLKALKDILTWSHAQPTARQTYRPLFLEEVSTLADGKLVEIGAHTVTHPFLSAQSKELQRYEIEHSKTYLEKILNRSVTSVSYPFGDRTTETIELARCAGFDCACSTAQGLVWYKSNRFDLPRFAVENWNGEEFVKQLLRWFHE
ncbi:polysaccharide deacetylase family protein [Tolypothrix sp. FACHB-123]|uniref:polysaccharide deacetylase family protein n=1 Tax=Tolypothrix sp. FACHB-123 TaxID=2692868 RepID=UPI001685797D|nr:polysaccharide deacetylase family protein [Tolypothrix sp. FACHB-123]MBD2358445.1 polysaccharide deacetylase family protein [Tolypothrix sp. FACHB-123]